VRGSNLARPLDFLNPGVFDGPSCSNQWGHFWGHSLLVSHARCSVALAIVVRASRSRSSSPVRLAATFAASSAGLFQASPAGPGKYDLTAIEAKLRADPPWVRPSPQSRPGGCSPIRPQSPSPRSATPTWYHRR
jgi:hypothetical protein